MSAGRRLRSLAGTCAAAAIASAAALASFPGEAQAHPHIFFDIEIKVELGAGSECGIAFVLTPDRTTCMAMLMEADENGDGQVDDPEMTALTDNWSAYFGKFGHFLRIRSGDSSLPAGDISGFKIARRKDAKDKYSISYVVVADLPERGPGTHRLEVDLTDDTIYAAFTQKAENALVSCKDRLVQVKSVSVLSNNRGIGIDYAVSESPKNGGTAARGEGGETAIPAPVQASAQPARSMGIKRRFYSVMQTGMDEIGGMLGKLTDDFSLGLFMAFMGFALLYGMFHALGPGHGKALVAAFLIRGNTKPRHALWLSLVVTITHTGTAVLLCVGVELARSAMEKQAFRDAGEAWIGFGSGILVLLIGVSPLLYVAWKAAWGMLAKGGFKGMFGAAREVMASAAALDEEEITMARIGRWGVAAGLVPCPASIVILLISASAGVFWIGLAGVLALAMGLSLVLLLIGLAVIGSRRGLQARLGQSVWMGRLNLALAAGGMALVCLMGVLMIGFYSYRLEKLGVM